MKLKALLKFYFSADFLNAYLDGAVLKYALNYAGEAEDIADLIFAVTSVSYTHLRAHETSV